MSSQTVQSSCGAQQEAGQKPRPLQAASGLQGFEAAQEVGVQLGDRSCLHRPQRSRLDSLNATLQPVGASVAKLPLLLGPSVQSSPIPPS